jgi:sulfonate transport system substrate-binding protein
LRRIALFALTFVLAAAQAHAEPPPSIIRFAEVGGGTAKPAGAGMVPLAKRLGLFDSEFGPHGPMIQTDFFAGTGPAINQALAQGQTDFGSYGAMPNVIGLASNIPARLVFVRRATGLPGYIAVAPGSAVRAWKDLRGKRIAVQKGTNPYLTLVLLLEAAGLKESDVTIVNLERADALAAFLSGHVDAVYNSALLFNLRDQGKARLLTTPDLPAVNDTNSSGTLVTSSFERRYPQTTARVVKVLVQAALWASQPQNREAYLRFIADSGIPYKYAAESYGVNLKARFNPAIDDSVVQGYRHIASFAESHRLVRTGAQVTPAWFQTKYIKAALHDLHLETYWQAP